MELQNKFYILVTPEVDDEFVELMVPLLDSRFEWIRVDPLGDSEGFYNHLKKADCYITKNKDLGDTEYKIAGNLKLFQLPIAGYDAVNLCRAQKYGIPVANNGGANAVSVAEHFFLLTLALYRHLLNHHNSVMDGSWINLKHSNLEMAGKELGIVGLGNVGRQVAIRAQAFQMNIAYYDIIRPDPAFEKKYGLTYKPLEILLQDSDIVTYHVPLTSKTRNMINEVSLGSMKSTCVLINTSRGEIQDEDAIYDCLSQGRLLGAGLDVFNEEPLPRDSKLLTLGNVIFTPHAGPSYETRFKAARNVVENIRRIVSGNTPVNLAVDYESIG
ncbi:MAG: hypothetical protein KKC46_02410 [Proteobacteria bacterium]|nr:hypothetical protein [Pseudomonadota bacterium]